MPTLTDTLRLDVANLATPAGRVVGNPGHAAARDYLLGRLRQLDLAPYRNGSLDLPYRVGEQGFHNLVAVVPGADRIRRPLLVGAHYDSVIAACCADDNAAAVAIALSAAAVGR
jgi:hypothetical protein